ncbi:4-alpha-glucanotransferase [Frankia sp. Ag45/Mut15]|uniref:4-alpha-glucanotransferase n=1 Tax=Frankia umida TaxID=573489 RepID=A0ABT0JXV9_9ACTN|nr:4-alpha-glucanotransferase [Frankia umida]
MSPADPTPRPAPAAPPIPAAAPAPADPAALADPVPADLAALADACGVAVGYTDALDQPVPIAADTVRAVLGLLGIDPSDPVAALDRLHEARWRRQLPPCAVVSAATPESVTVYLPVGVDVHAEVELETGARLALAAPGGPRDRRELDGQPWVARPIALPAGLPLGDHVLHVTIAGQPSRCPVIAVPDVLPGPAALRARGPRWRAWGWMIQLYALRSEHGWGMGDYGDLGELAAWSGAAGADVLLVNPLHAAAPTLPVADSPYSPVSRRFAAPLYLRPEATREYAQADAATRAAVDDLAARARRDGRPDGLLDRDVVWTAKLAALELLFATTRPAGSANATTAEAADAAEPGDADLADFATWCALAERHGPDWRGWPAGLTRPDTDAVAAARVELADRIAFHSWLQHRCDEQLATAQATARAAGMAAGIVHDLAVGVDAGGADAWALQDVLAVAASVGAPPDSFNQQGQDWGLPPWRPQALAETGYAPLREMVAAVLRRGGGLRVDHILGLFRLWWIPRGAGAARGTYVRYDAKAMLGLLALEATRADALVVGEDLGTVEPSMATALDAAGVLGSSVLWFEQDEDGNPLPPARYRAATMASVTTHDLPTAAGYLEGEHVRLRAGLGLLGRSEQAEADAWRRDRDALLALLRTEGLLDTEGPLDTEGLLDTAGAATPASPGVGQAFPPGDLDAYVRGMHRLLVRSPCQVVLAAPGDALGDRHQPNLPGTTDAYPNWRLPVRDGDGAEVTLERLLAEPAVARLGALLGEVRADAGTESPNSPSGGGRVVPLSEDPGTTSR